MPGTGWTFVTKKNLTDALNWEWETYPVAYFEDGVPWFATRASATLRKPSSAERFWGALVSPGQNAAAVWNEAKAENRVYLGNVDKWLRDQLYRHDGWRISREELRAYADEEFNPAAVTAVLNTPAFECVPGDGGYMYWTLTEKS
jgi:hypothetical protein